MNATSRLVHQVLDRLLPERPSTPDVDLPDVAERLHVADVRFARHSEGFTDFAGKRPIIYLDPTLPTSRLQFTLAHKLGHVVLRTPEAGDLVHLAASAADEERLCDRLAAALLMPTAWVEHVVVQQPCLHGLRYAADAAGVSLSSLVVELAGNSGGYLLLRLQRGTSGRWVAVARAGWPYRLKGPLRVPIASARMLAAGAPASGRSQSPHRTVTPGCPASPPTPCTERAPDMAGAAGAPYTALVAGSPTLPLGSSADRRVPSTSPSFDVVFQPPMPQTRGPDARRRLRDSENVDRSMALCSACLVETWRVEVGQFAVELQGEVRRSPSAALMLARLGGVRARRLLGYDEGQFPP